MKVKIQKKIIKKFIQFIIFWRKYINKNLDKQLKQEKKRGICKNCFTKRRLSELEKQKMETLIDEILLSKKNISKDVVKKTKENNEFVWNK